MVVYLGWVDSYLGSSPGWRAVTTAICCLTGGWNISNLSQPNPGPRPSGSPSISRIHTFPALCHDRPPRVDYDGVSEGGALLVVPAGLGGRRHVALRLDRPRPQERLPVRQPRRHRERRRVRQDVGPAPRQVLQGRDSTHLKMSYTGFSSQLGTKLRDWAVWPVGAGCYSRAVLSSNGSKTL